MFLKRLTMKGFKSFADTTILEFEPGVTAVVGPNGSGKSNVVDAVTWVLGAQSTRALRSAKMDDVIFMGTTTRPALGRAEVALTIDNSSGRLAIDGAEVTISRTLFRNGDSEYAINATTCRLLDVQELLSDSGVGRQQHMIIGQGQLDAILNSSSESRRAVIEEAAGVLKHRRRKERAQRRLDATQENLERLGDLVREVRRQMRPLERQAASARSYGEVEGELRAARHAWVADRLEVFARRRRELDSTLDDEAARERELRDELVTLDARASAVATEMASRREEMLASTLGRLQALAERARGSASIITERERALRAALVASADENVIATLEADAARLGDDLVALEAQESALPDARAALARARRAFDDVVGAYESARGSDSAERDEVALAAGRERVALLERSLASQREAERRAAQRLAEARARAGEHETRRGEVNAMVIAASAALAVAEREHVHAADAAARAEDVRGAADAALRDATDAAARTQARAEALTRALEELSGSGGRAIIGDLDGVLGAFLDLIEVEPGAERAVEAAAGASTGAMVVDGRRAARAALAALRREGGAGLILPVAEGEVVPSDAPAGAVALRGLVRARRGAPAHVTRVLDALLARAFVVADWESGLELALDHPELVLVTREGDRFAASGWRVASGRALVTRSAVEEAHAGALAAASAVVPLREAQGDADALAVTARRALNDAATGLARAQAQRERVDAEMASLEGDLATTGSLIEALGSEAAAAAARVLAAHEEVDELRAELPDLEAAVAAAGERARAAEAARGEVEAQRVRVSDAATALSRLEADLAARRSLLERRRREIEERLEGRGAEREEAAGRRESLEADGRALRRLAALVERAADEIRLTQETMDSTYREQLEASRASAERLEEIRRERQRVDARLGELADVRRHGEVERAELAVKVANLHEVAQRDLGLAAADLGPAPVVDLAEGVSLEQRVGELEARISSLGPINPLALDELAALEERYRDLDEQVSDVRHARRELQEVVRALDDEIMTTFASAYADVNEHFAHLVGMLFPGGQGRLILTDPDDPLNTGVEIEVRPMGRNIRRISLLSGGERSMVTLAFLFAVFRSRPSPFYMMDEVEAALDDVNLQRFLSLVDEFRDEAQLLIVTHQKRTMEAADALYGVTMVPGGSSKVVSQRVSRTLEVPV